MSKYRKVLAAILAATMVLGSGVVANADEGSANGDGSIDIVERSDIFSVVLPVDTGQFDYILDPTGVIAETNYDKYGGRASASFVDNKTVYFANEPATASDPVPYTDTSITAKATNKSTMDVEIRVAAKVNAVEGVTMATDSTTVASAEEPVLYLGLMDVTNTREKAITTTEVVATSSIANADAEYVKKWDSATNKYIKELPATASNFADFEFKLRGECSPTQKWAGKTAPTVSLVWTIDNPTGASEVNVAAISRSASTGAVSIRLVTGQNADRSKITSVKVDGTATTNYSVVASGAITVNGVSAGSHTIVVVYDGTTYKGTL